MREMMPVGIPSGFVVLGPDGRPVVFEFDRFGKAKPDSGLVMPWQGWVAEVGVHPDEILLVEHFAAEGGRMLMNLMDTGLLREEGRKVTVMELAAQGRLWEKAERFWTEYMRRVFG